MIAPYPVYRIESGHFLLGTVMFYFVYLFIYLFLFFAFSGFGVYGLSVLYAFTGGGCTSK
jgi:hypothetical protein